MILKEMIDRLRIPCEIEIRDYLNNMICKTKTNNKGITPYLNYDVVEWFVSFKGNAFCILIDDREADNE